MELFEKLHEPKENLLPFDGTVHNLGILFNEEESQHYFNSLLNEVDWKHDEAIIFGKRILTKRKFAWYGDKDYEYTYSKINRRALPWNTTLKKLKELVEKHSDESYNSCLLNLYHNGEEGVAWHSDDEKTLKPLGAIASLSLGASRKFSFRHKTTKEEISINLHAGQLLVMKDSTQINWLHSLPKTKKCTMPRISLTFRTIVSATCDIGPGDGIGRF
ncbi:MAG: alpha-ketoglutarate-dependent dioxygenase AlkB [Saprospiraceae bacterium]|nr:alpha-ketoglutarate-dependent dioxygenase AlkB [Candidatus Vicinibacter affinis]